MAIALRALLATTFCFAFPAIAQQLLGARGKGQIILFAGQPLYRGATLGTHRLLLNAMVYGPALGTDHSIIP
jgi:hypothetical protein